jgi:hypothetical protein
VLTPTDTDADGLADATDILEDSDPMYATRGVVTKTPSRNAALAAPKVTASALSVVIPATGEAVRYEQLLIEANQTQTIDIDARRRLRR